VLCAAFIYLHVTREKLQKRLLYIKGVLETLMKLTPGRHPHMHHPKQRVEWEQKSPEQTTKSKVKSEPEKDKFNYNNLFHLSRLEQHFSNKIVSLAVFYHHLQFLLPLVYFSGPWKNVYAIWQYL